MQWIVLLLFVFAVYFGIAMLFGYFINLACHYLHADWTNFWGWTILSSIAPALRGWIMGNGN